MAEPITITQLTEASLNADSLETLVNGGENTTVTTRTGQTYPSAKKAIKTLFLNGALPAIPFATKALMTASALANGAYAQVTDGGTDSGLYLKTSGAWAKSAYDPVAQANAYTDSNKLDYKDVTNEYVNGNMIGENSERHVGFGLSSAGVLQVRDYFDSVILNVFSGDSIYLHYGSSSTFTAGADFGFYSDNPYENQSQTPLPVVVSDYIVNPDNGIRYKVAKVPTDAKYLMINTRYDRTTPVSFNWGVGRNSFVLNTQSGEEKVSAINGKRIDVSLAVNKSFEYTNNKLKDYEQLKLSTKNLFNGSFISKNKVTSLGMSLSVYENDTTTGFIPVQNGNYYTISGIDTSLVRTNVASIGGFSDTTDGAFIKELANVAASKITVFIDNPAITHIALSVTDNNLGTLEKAQSLPLQVELGQVATTYEPYLYSTQTKKVVATNKAELTELINQKTALKSLITHSSEFTELASVRTPDVSDIGLLRKDLSPTGMMYKLQKDVAATKPNSSNNLFAEIKNIPSGKRSIRANVHKIVNGNSEKGTLSSTIFTVPSGQFDNPNTLPEQTKYSKSGFVHPSIAYDGVGVGGFKYWMIASTLPAFAMNGATWEDEDMFVSNDAKTWQRIRSLYETDKSYTTTTLRLPPQTLARVDARQNAILPVPAQGDTIEMSMPADNGAPAVDRQITLLNGIKTPFKHDPAILIHGGFVYTYHSFHVPYAGRDGGTNRFIVCVRTANGVDWDVVRTDGSTMRLTEASSRQIFTKDDQGRYNYIAYFYSYGGSNPEIVKYGENDFEFIYGNNFSRRYKGTTPYNFDFTTVHPFQDVGSGNHPATLWDGTALYLINNTAVYSSTNRGETFTKLLNYPMWLGGISGIPYKKSLCKGANGKLILVEAQRYDLQTYNIRTAGLTNQTNRDHQLTIYEYPSITDFVNKATTSFIDAYIDVQLCRVNYTTQTREFIAISAVNNKVTLSGVNRPLQVIELASMDFKDGDLLFVFVTLNSRHSTAEIQFGGVDIV